MFRFGFSDLIQAWHALNDGLDENVTWRHDMTQALDLPLHEAITESRVTNSGWNFMLIICRTGSVLGQSKYESYSGHRGAYSQIPLVKS